MYDSEFFAPAHRQHPRDMIGDVWDRIIYGQFNRPLSSPSALAPVRVGVVGHAEESPFVPRMREGLGAAAINWAEPNPLMVRGKEGSSIDLKHVVLGTAICSGARQLE
jgi:hypothetical protein